jgi:hypothetical protein
LPNGIEGYRQKTPKDIVKNCGLLVRAGADVHAGADATSAHAARHQDQQQCQVQ